MRLWRKPTLSGRSCGWRCLVWVAVTLALRPWDRLGAVIALRPSDDLAPVGVEVPQEVRALFGAINSFMARLDTALDVLRNFTGNACHQVRTQLALIDRSSTPAQTEAATAKAQTAIERAERVLEQFQVLVRVDAASGSAPLQRVNQVANAKDLTAELVPQALVRSSSLALRAPTTPLPRPNRS